MPGIVRWPGKVPAGRTSSAIVSTLDVLPTFAAFADASAGIPSYRMIDGVDQRDLFAGRSVTGARNGFLYFDGNELQAVREGAWKLRLPNLKRFRQWTELDRGTQAAELYNLEQDLGEKENLAAQQTEIVRRLGAIAAEVKAEIGLASSE